MGWLQGAAFFYAAYPHTRSHRVILIHHIIGELLCTFENGVIRIVMASIAASIGRSSKAIFASCTDSADDEEEECYSKAGHDLFSLDVDSDVVLR